MHYLKIPHAKIAVVNLGYEATNKVEALHENGTENEKYLIYVVKEKRLLNLF